MLRLTPTVQSVGAGQEDLNNHWEDWLLAHVDELLERKLSAY